MDLFTFYAQHQVLICKPCACAIAPLHLISHIKNVHAHEACRDAGLDFAKSRANKVANAIAKCLQEKYNLLDPSTQKIPRPLPTEPPLLDLKLYRGYQCSRCDFVLSRTKLAQECMKQHFNQHRLLPWKRGRPAKIADILEEDKGPLYSEVYCQRFFASRHQSSFFTVNVPTQVQEVAKTKSRGHPDLYRALIDEQLSAGNHEQDARAQVYSSQVSKTKVSPWLEMTRWPRYFNGLNMADVAPLAYAANLITEPALVILGESFERLIKRAYQSIREDRISVFDEAQINSFIAGRSAKYDRMLMVKLRKSTFRAYKSLWKRLLCFAYRTSRPTRSIPLPHRLTNAQLFHLNRVLCVAEEILSFQRLPGSDASPTEGDREGEVVRDLDRASLQLCIALLDHTLKGDHFESVVLSFLAVLGIDENAGGVFRGPLSYSPDLSKFIKTAQMLVVQRSVVAAEEGEVDHPSDMLDEMRERFMVRGSRTAFDWACRLRSYAKKVVSNTTSLGSIAWSEDGSSVQYKDTGFSMDALRKFVASQVRKAQQELEDLLLLYPDEARNDVVPQVLLHRLQDNHSNEKKGWNFLQDQRNADQLRQGGDRWLLDRVLENDWLRDEMLAMSPEAQLRWKKKAVQAYFEKVDEFLERLLLLIHMTGGQPPRGTELIGLQHSNTAQGQHRSVFIKEGLISTVTLYYKG